jgi:hypothetical protein
MTAVLLHVRADFRRRWRAWAGLALIVVLTVGPVLVLSAGARRTDTAYPRFLSTEHVADVLAYFAGPNSAEAKVVALPEVSDYAASAGLPVSDPSLFAEVLSDGRYGRTINGFKILHGRRLDPKSTDEAVIGFVLARQRHLHVGSAINVALPLPGAPELHVHVVGIEASPSEFPPQTFTDGASGLYLPAGVLSIPDVRRAAALGGGTSVVAFHLHGGQAGVDRFLSDATRITHSPVGSTSLAAQSANIERSMHLQAVSLWIMAACAAAAGALLILQLLTRHFAADSADHEVLAALGATRGQVLGSAVGRVTATAAVAVLGAVVTAFAASPLLPLGTARTAEPHPGFSFDAVTLGIGGAAAVAAVVLLGAIAVVRAHANARQANRRAVERTSLLGRGASAAGLPVTITTGVTLALDPGRGRNAVPVRTTLVAAIVGVVAIAAAVTFGASLDHLLTTPRLYGTTFDTVASTNGNFEDVSPLVPALLRDPDVAAAAIAESGIPMQVGRVTFGGLYVDPVKGALPSTVISGRPPVGPDEIVLGSRTMDKLRTHVGATIDVDIQGITRSRPMRVVGRGVFAPLGDDQQLGDGGLIAPPALDAFARLAAPGFKAPPPGDAFVAFRPGIDRSAAIAAIQRQLGQRYDVTFTRLAQPSDVFDVGQVRGLPRVLAALLSLVALATIAYLLITATRRRRRELAVLKTLGFLPRQVRSAVSWQATTIAVAGLVIGLPLGIAAGRSAWELVAGDLGVIVRPVVPWTWVVALVPIAILIAAAVAAGPAAAAGRIRPAEALRAE